MIYLDNAATSGIKPESVYQASDHALRCCSGNPGRSGHDISLAAGNIVDETRLLISELFNAGDASCICFTNNATTALNTAILGTATAGSHIITSALEHNSVSRPLEYLKSLGCRITVIPASMEHGVDPDDVRRTISPDTSLVVMTHISNVTGTVNDVASIGSICRDKGIPFLVDAAQSAGLRTIDVQADKIDLLAFPGHKGLLGPQGTGGLYIRKGLKVNPLTRGGTGSFSESLDQPEERPSAFESGTLNVPGIAGLGAGIKIIKEIGIDRIHAREDALRKILLAGLHEISTVHIYSPPADADAGCVISFTMDTMDPSGVSMILNSQFQIAVRSGLHCAPYAHAMLQTLDKGGTVRVSPGFFNTEEEMHIFLDSIREISDF